MQGYLGSLSLAVYRKASMAARHFAVQQQLPRTVKHLFLWICSKMAHYEQGEGFGAWEKKPERPPCNAHTSSEKVPLQEQERLIVDRHAQYNIYKR